MAQTYTRQSSIADGDTITAALFNNEYNQLLNAFAYSSSSASSTGHRHDGSTAQGGNIYKIGDLDFLNKIEADSTNNRWGIYVEVSSAAVEQIRIQDGAIVPVTDNDIDLGTSSLEFKDAYFDGTVYADAINFNGTAISATAAELNIMDGVTATAAELNILDGVTSTAAELNILDGVTASATDLNLIDGITNGTVIASKAIITDSNKDITGGRNITISGELDAATLDISGDADIDGTLEADAITIAGVTLAETISDTVGAMVSSNTETNITVTYEDSDNTLDFVIGTLNQDTTGTAALATTVTLSANNSTDETIFPVFADGATGTQGLETDTGFTYNPSSGKLTATEFVGNIDAVDGDFDGTLETDALSIGGTTVTSTAAELNILDGVTSTAAELNILDGVTASATDLNLIDGITNGTVIASKAIVTDSNKDISGGRNITISGELDAATLDISGDADIDGTLEADAITIGGVTLAETISDTVGAMVTSNTESGITVAYQDADNTLDFTIGTLNQDTTGTAAVATTVTITDNESTNENNAIVFTAGGDLDGGNLGLESDGDLKYNPSTGTLSATNISVSGTFSTVNSVTMNANNAVVFEGSTADAHETTLSSIDATGDRTINLPNVSGTLPVLAAASATQISSTPEELNILDGATVVVGEINALDLGSTAVGTAIASKAVILDSNKDYTGIRNLTITGELDGATLDISGDADIDGTTNLDVVDIDGAVDMASTLAVTGIVTLTDDLIIGDGKTIGSASDVDAMTIASNGQVTFTQTLIGTALDISGDADIDGTLETDALTINGSALNYKAFGTASIMLGDNATGTIDAANNNTGVGVDVFAALTTGDDNVAIGRLALTANTTGSSNTAVGRDAMEANTTASNNTAVGVDSLKANTTGTENSAFGAGSLRTNTTGDYNTAFGYECLRLSTTSDQNTAMGYYALGANTTGTLNTGLGAQALDANTTGSNNTAVGQLALSGSTTANNNTAIGTSSLQSTTTGSENQGFGTYALTSNTTGASNTSVGYNALGANTTASNNTAMGFRCLQANTTGEHNTAIGYQAGTANTTGQNNSFIGDRAGDSVTTGAQNTIVGSFSAPAVTTGSGHTVMGYGALQNATTIDYGFAIGYEAGAQNTSGAQNTYVGNFAGDSVTTGGDNTMTGFQAGAAVTTGTQNTTYGHRSGDNITTGNTNTLIGAAVDGSGSGTSNANGLGYNLSCQDNFTTIGQGSSDCRNAHGEATWATVSDERVKKDIEDSTVGLAFINDLRPVTFNYKNKGDLPENFNGYEEGSTEVYKNSKSQHGFIAQEVKAAIDKHSDIKEGFSMWDDDDPSGQQRVGETAVIPVLVKAVQELSAQVEELKAQINEDK